MRILFQYGWLAFFLLSGSGCKFRQKVSLVVHDATIYAADTSFSIHQAMAIQDGKIVAIGSNETILREYDAEEMLDAKGQFVYPGLIDAHCHFTGYATDMWKCDVTGTTSFEAVLEKMKRYALTAKTTILYGRGWDQNDWLVKYYPDKAVLDSLFPSRPVFIKRIDGHAAIANQRMLDIAGVKPGATIAGGTFEMRNGQLTGILIDNAMDEVERFIPLIADSTAQQYFLQAQDTCFQYGLTGVHDCGVSEHTVNLVDAAQQSGDLKMKIFALLSDSAQYYEPWIKKGPYITRRLHVGGFKMYADGALGSRGACLVHPYADQPGWTGFMLSDYNHFKQVAEKLINTKFQLCTHAIGDSGNRVMLNLYAGLLKGPNDRRWRIEHAQVVNESDRGLFGRFNIIPSVQPTHATSDMYWAGDRLGSERIATAYAYKKLLQQNNWMPLGTDFPVEDINPFKTFYAAVARMDSKGFPAGGFQLADALSRKEALWGMTLWAAKAAFEEHQKGSLEPGKAADFFISSTDLLNCDISKLLNTRVTATFVEGERVFGK